MPKEKTHKHNWDFMIGPDETGALIHCIDKTCGKIEFLEPAEMKKFKKLLDSGIKGTEIYLNNENNGSKKNKK